MERYSREHAWARREGTLVRVGISAFAQAELGEMAHVELPELGRRLTRGEPACTIESMKSTSEVYAPVGGKVAAINEELQDDERCGLVNQDPLGQGWLFLLAPEDEGELEELMSPEQYQRWVEGPEAIGPGSAEA